MHMHLVPGAMAVKTSLSPDFSASPNSPGRRRRGRSETKSPRREKSATPAPEGERRPAGSPAKSDGPPEGDRHRRPGGSPARSDGSAYTHKCDVCGQYCVGESGVAMHKQSSKKCLAVSFWKRGYEWKDAQTRAHKQWKRQNKHYSEVQAKRPETPERGAPRLRSRERSRLRPVTPERKTRTSPKRPLTPERSEAKSRSNSRRKTRSATRTRTRTESEHSKVEKNKKDKKDAKKNKKEKKEKETKKAENKDRRRAVTPSESESERKPKSKRPATNVASKAAAVAPCPKPAAPVVPGATPKFKAAKQESSSYYYESEEEATQQVVPIPGQAAAAALGRAAVAAPAVKAPAPLRVTPAAKAAPPKAGAPAGCAGIAAIADFYESQASFIRKTSGLWSEWDPAAQETGKSPVWCLHGTINLRVGKLRTGGIAASDLMPGR